MRKEGSKPPRFQAYAGDDATADSVREAAALAGITDGEIRPGGLAEAHERLSTGRAPEILLVDVSDCEDVVGAMNRLADECEQHTRVVAVGSVNDVELYRKLIELGVTDYLVKPVTAQSIAAALRRATQRATAAAGAASPPKRNVIAVIGSRGGVGATSLAIAIAWGLAHRHGLRTVLLDLDLQLGSVAMGLDLEPSRGLREILATPDRIDTLLIASAVTQESDKLRILSAEESLESELVLDGKGLKPLLDELGQDADAIVIDLPRRLDSLARAALAEADHVCIVADLSLVSMRDAKRLLRLVAGLNSAGERLLVANRVGGVAGEVPQPEFERGIDAKFDFVLREDARASAAAADQGKSLLEAAPESSLAADLGRVLARLSGSTEAPAGKPGRSWVKRLIGT